MDENIKKVVDTAIRELQSGDNFKGTIEGVLRDQPFITAMINPQKPDKVQVLIDYSQPMVYDNFEIYQQMSMQLYQQMNSFDYAVEK